MKQSWTIWVKSHYCDVTWSIYSAIESRICSDWQQKKHQRSALLSLCEGIPPVTVGCPAQRDSNVENFSIWWRHDKPVRNQNRKLDKAQTENICLVCTILEISFCIADPFYLKLTGFPYCILTLEWSNRFLWYFVANEIKWWSGTEDLLPVGCSTGRLHVF